MTFAEVMSELEKLSNPATKKVFLRHGAKEPFYGVKVQDLKTIQKKIKKNHSLSLELYNSGNSDAMYLAGLIAEPKDFTKQQLKDWVKKAYWYMISEYTIAWVTAESKYGWELGLEWIDSSKENIASSGWATLSGLIAIHNDEEIDIELVKKLLARCKEEIHKSPNRVKYTMNNFIIAAGSYIKTLHNDSIEIAKEIGKVEVDMGGTSCKVPEAVEYITKAKLMGRLGKKRKSFN